jgi:hypothetical protein
MGAVDLTGRRRSSPATARSGWDPQDLRRRLALALEIAERAVVVLGTDGYGGDGRDALRPEKVLAETALLLVASRPVVADAPVDSELGPRHRRLAETLVPFGRNERVAALVTLEPSVSLEHAFVHIALTQIGMPDARFDRLLEAAQAASAARSRERLPHRRLEQAWMRRLAGLRDDGSAADLADRIDVATSILAHPLDALASTSDDAYAFTHALMYAGELGSRVPRLPRRRAVEADAEAALGGCLDDEDFDLGGEMLLTWPLLRRPWSAAATFGFACLAAIEDEAGFLPGLSVSTEAFAALEGEERTRYAVAMSYHTAYVMGLLCAMSLHPGPVPPRTVPSSRRHRGASDALARLADGDGSSGRPRHWESRFTDLAAGQRDALAPLVLAIRLRRAARDRDLALVQALLRLAADYDLLSAPAPRQALELLSRARLLQGATVASDRPA